MKHRQLTGTFGAIVLVASTAWVSGGNSAYALTFVPPPDSSAPSQATGGASRGAVNFLPPAGQGTPTQSTGGASRGTVNFLPPAGQGTPTQSTGGASRGSLFVPAAGNGSPRQGSVGGASRDGMFTPAAGSGTPTQAAGGASRGQLFTPASSSGSPNQSAGGASRNGTYDLGTAIAGADSPAAILALLPQSYFGTTISEHPTMLVYLPASAAKEMVFSLKDEAGNVQHKMALPVSGAAGIVAIQLPVGAPALAVGKSYQWFLALKVDGRLSPNTPYIDGWVKRIEPDAELAAALQHPDALKRATALGAKGVWYDCVATMARLRATQPQNKALAKDWSDLLVSAGLKEITNVPLAISAN